MYEWMLLASVQDLIVWEGQSEREKSEENPSEPRHGGSWKERDKGSACSIRIRVPSTSQFPIVAILSDFVFESRDSAISLAACATMCRHDSYRVRKMLEEFVRIPIVVLRFKTSAKKLDMGKELQAASGLQSYRRETWKRVGTVVGIRTSSQHCTVHGPLICVLIS